jgi:mono/diheme cytochrome c family protein
MSAILLLLFACGGDPTPGPSGASPTPVAAAPAPKPVEVGPDGPASIVLPAGFPATTAALPTDAATLAAGEATYNAKGCASCHQFGTKLVGPDLVGVGDRRTPPWIGRMITKPEVMVKEDPQARALFAQLMTPMANQGILEADLLPLVAYIVNKKGP